MSAKSRIYKILNAQTGTFRLIEAQTQAQVARYLVANDYSIVPCNGIEAVKMAAEGTKLESALTSGAETEVAETAEV